MVDRLSVLVGMSGGVDSSVASWLLKRDGYKVTGATLKLFDDGILLRHPTVKDDVAVTDDRLLFSRSCCSLEDVESARNAAWRMGIEHYVFNVKADFFRHVVQPFVDDYLGGATPNPCIECNRLVRFDKLLQRAMALGIDKIATGHYARVDYDEACGRWLLYRSRDVRKDQTYMLYGLSQEILSHLIFPIFSYEKRQIRELADEAGLDSAQKPDSQDICFIPSGDYATFLERFYGRPLEPGDFLDNKGQVVGRHNGVARYTIGQRKGLGVTFGRPCYVVGKDSKTNAVYLGDTDDLMVKAIYVSRVNWIINTPGEGWLDGDITVKIRHGVKEFGALVKCLADGSVYVEFKEYQMSVSPGQSVVLYEGDLVLGGGIIRETMK